MAFSNCAQCGKPSKKAKCDDCFAVTLSDLVVSSRSDFLGAHSDAVALMRTAPFLENEAFFWPWVIRHKFLEDCYYHSKLSGTFNKHDLSLLPDFALIHIPKWSAKDRTNNAASLAKTFYDEIVADRRVEDERLLKEAAIEAEKRREWIEINTRQRLEREKVEAEKRREAEKAEARAKRTKLGIKVIQSAASFILPGVGQALQSNFVSSVIFIGIFFALVGSDGSGVWQRTASFFVLCLRACACISCLMYERSESD
jgi:hypothetical protein